MTMLQSNTTTVPARLKEARRMAGLSTRAMGAALGVSHTTIAKWERGEGEPSVSQFILWARATNQPAEVLLGGLIVEDVRPKRLELPTFCSGAWSVADDAAVWLYSNSRMEA